MLLSRHTDSADFEVALAEGPRIDTLAPLIMAVQPCSPRSPPKPAAQAAQSCRLTCDGQLGVYTRFSLALTATHDLCVVNGY